MSYGIDQWPVEPDHQPVEWVLVFRLMAEAIEISQLKTKKAVVETGLRLLIQIKKQERIKSLRGRLKWDGDLEKMRLDQ